MYLPLGNSFSVGRRKSSSVPRYSKYAYIALRQNNLPGSFDYDVEESQPLKDQKIFMILRNMAYILAVSFGKYVDNITHINIEVSTNQCHK